jgi:signal transduction histidine kinase
MQSLDMRSITDEVISTLSRRMEDEGRMMKLARDIPSDISPIYGDRERILQVMDNLLANAYQYTQPGGTITIRMRKVNSFVQVDIQDTGIGIKPEEKERVFERFYRGDDPLIYATSGNGLGLSIVKKMVEMHGGRIWLESHGIPGLGSIFSFTLPIYNPENLPDLEKQSSVTKR